MTQHMGLEQAGYVFRKRYKLDNLGQKANDVMVRHLLSWLDKYSLSLPGNQSSDQFLVCLRNNLCDIGLDPRMYGTHSFRRGGCQYLHMSLRWPMRQICAWGGWSEAFDNTGTIFKYLISWTDSPTLKRSEYFNPRRQGTDPCTACGRTCQCA